MEEKIFEYEPEETGSARLMRKTKESPFFVIGLTGMAFAVLYGAYRYKHRGNISTSVYLMQLRVAAQGTAVGCITIGMACNMYKDFMAHRKIDT